MIRRPQLLVLAVMAVLLTMVASPSAAFAAVNDNFSNATVITSLPFTDSVDTTGTTSEPGEPQACYFMSQTVWYVVTLGASEVLKADNSGSSVFADLNVYQQNGSGFGGLSFLGCAPGGGAVEWTAQAGTTYYIQTGTPFGSGILTTNVNVVPPPSNDNFADAISIPSLPFSSTEDISGATLETGEPTPSCGYGPLGGSVWYAFTPATSGSASASVSSNFSSAVAAYTGTSLTSLTNLGCRAFGQVLTIHVDAGTTYYYQVGGLFGQRGTLTFNLIVTPPPVASFVFSPSDPSIFDTIQFYDQSYDPGGVGFQTEAWNFGDGTTGTGCCPTHRYAADGGYTAKLTVITFDGRSASASQVVHVRTHDVAITRFMVPTTASVGQTRMISVRISDTRYPETVQVQLFKSVPGPFNNFQLVGTLTQSVPVLTGGRTTPFSFNYTFTSDDRVAGKVTFEAIATIIGARDAQPADNTAISSPCTVIG